MEKHSRNTLIIIIIKPGKTTDRVQDGDWAKQLHGWVVGEMHFNSQGPCLAAAVPIAFHVNNVLCSESCFSLCY